MAVMRFTLAAMAAAAASAVTVMIPMRDGVQLHTEIDQPPFFPAGKRVPAILERSPYGANAEELIATVFSELLGYISVRQDMRGTGQSEGNFTMWHDSQNDAYDTLSWIVQQDWSNGMVFTTGVSADGIDEYAQMSNPHPAIRGQVVVFASVSGWETFYIGGAYREALIDGWLHGTVPGQYAYLDAYVKTQEQPDTPWWSVLNGTLWYQNIKWPSLHWGGWYDIFQQGNLVAYHGYQHYSDPSVVGQAKLVMDPLGHCQSASTFFSRDVLFGRVVLPILMALDFMQDDSAANKTYPSPPEGVGNVTLYIMGANETGSPGQYWTSVPEYPLPTPQAWYLQPGGSLTTTAPTVASSSTSYTYDPADPVPTIGGNNLLIPCGPLDQRPIETLNRQDVLVFTSEVLTQPVAAVGPLVANLWLSTNVTDTDVVVKLIDVYPANSNDPTLAGSSTLVADGITRLRWRGFPEAGNQPQLLSGNPADVYPVSVSLWNTSYIFAPGHQIRVHVSSSNHPRFMPNPNNGLPVDQVGPNVTAGTSLWHDAGHPSSISLPVVDPATQLPPFPVEEGVAKALAPFEEGWKARREAAGLDATVSLSDWLFERMSKVMDAMASKTVQRRA